MYTYVFTLKALNESFSFRISSPKDQELNDFFYVFLGLFPGIMDFEKKTIQCLTTNNETLRNNIKMFVTEHQASVPQINGLPAFFRRLSENEAFYIIPSQIKNQADSIRLSNYLLALNEGKSFEELTRQTDHFFADLLKNYEIHAFGANRLVVGERVKEKKVCRFCRRPYPEATFEKKRPMPFQKHLVIKHW